MRRGPLALLRQPARCTEPWTTRSPSGPPSPAHRERDVEVGICLRTMGRFHSQRRSHGLRSAGVGVEEVIVKNCRTVIVAKPQFPRHDGERPLRRTRGASVAPGHASSGQARGRRSADDEPHMRGPRPGARGTSQSAQRAEAAATADPSAPGGDPPPPRARRPLPLSDPSGGSPLGPRRG